MFKTILQTVIWGSYGLSTLITYFNNSSSNNRIKRKGFEIKPISENSVSENIKYFLKDFGFLFLPVFNLIHSIKQTVQKDSEFDSIKMDKLKDRDRLVEKKPKKEKKKEEEKPSQQVVPKLPERRKEKTLEEMNCYERRDYYKREYYRVLDLRKKAKEDGASVSVLNRYSHQLKLIVEAYKAEQRQCEIEDMHEQRNELLEFNSNSKKLVRK